MEEEEEEEVDGGSGVEDERVPSQLDSGGEDSVPVDLASTRDTPMPRDGSPAPVVPLGVHYGSKQVMKNQLAEKVDVMVAVCLQYLHAACHHHAPPSQGSHQPHGIVLQHRIGKHECPNPSLGSLNLEESKTLLRCLQEVCFCVCGSCHVGTDIP